MLCRKFEGKFFSGNLRKKLMCREFEKKKTFLAGNLDKNKFFLLMIGMVTVIVNGQAGPG